MKRIILVLAAALLGGLAMTACQKEANQGDIPENAIILITEDYQNDGKLLVRGNDVMWEEGEHVFINDNQYTVHIRGGKAYINPGESVYSPELPAGQPIYGYGDSYCPNAAITTGTAEERPFVKFEHLSVGAPEGQYEDNGYLWLNMPVVAYSQTPSEPLQFKHITAAVQVLVRNEMSGVDLLLDGVEVIAGNDADANSKQQLQGSVDATYYLDGELVVTPKGNRTENSVTVSFIGTRQPIIPYHYYEPNRPQEDGNYIEVQVPILPIGAGELTVKVYAHDATNIGHTFTYSNTVTINKLERNQMLTAGCRMNKNTGHVTEFTPPEGTTGGKFTVNTYYKKVYFSKGNLQYQASTGTWRFAEHQWDYVGTQTADGDGYYGGTVSGSDNSNISATYSGWIDLFGWGAWTGNNNPTETNGNSLPAYYSWANTDFDGTIENQNDWYTLTSAEWDYLLNHRRGDSYAKATVNGIRGLILLPDGWVSNSAMTHYNLRNTDVPTADYSSNIISLTDWTTKLESNGAVFLPAAGGRAGTSVMLYSGLDGHYWTASDSDGSVETSAADGIWFDKSSMTFPYSQPYSFGWSVRLVKN